MKVRPNQRPLQHPQLFKTSKIYPRNTGMSPFPKRMHAPKECFQRTCNQHHDTGPLSEISCKK